VSAQKTGSSSGSKLSGFLLLSILLSIAVLVVAYLIQRPHSSPAYNAPHAALDLRAGIDLSAQYLIKADASNGRFAYLVDADNGAEDRTYNIVRHSGAMYALAMLDDADPKRQTKAALIRSAGFLKQNFISSEIHPGIQVVWQKHAPEKGIAELGAAGLALVALSKVHQLEPSVVSLEDLQSLGRFVLYLQRPDGSFADRYEIGSGPTDGSPPSLYYPGEAALGLLSLYELDRSPVWLDAAYRALEYLAQSRANLTILPADHWALIATAKLAAICSHENCRMDRSELIVHAEHVCESILREQRIAPGTLTDGAFDLRGNTASAATRLEGLLAALEFLPDGDLHRQIRSAADRGIGFLLRSEIATGEYAGGFLESSTGAQRDQIRIDYVQHALCALLRYRVLSVNG